MNKIFIVLLFILLGSSLIVINNIKGTTENSFIVEYQNNKNLAMPDLTGKTEILPGIYRLHSQNGGHLDYNINTGHYRVHGAFTGQLFYSFGTRPTGDHYAQIWEVEKVSYDNSSIVFLGGPSPSNVVIENAISYQGKVPVYSILYSIQTYKQSWVGVSNIDVTFKVQLEKGSRATRYVVPKIYPIYKDNLTQEEKQQIGMGAFEGIPQIIRTINNILKPVTDFVNGILSLFS